MPAKSIAIQKTLFDNTSDQKRENRSISEFLVNLTESGCCQTAESSPTDTYNNTHQAAVIALGDQTGFDKQQIIHEMTYPEDVKTRERFPTLGDRSAFIKPLDVRSVTQNLQQHTPPVGTTAPVGHRPLHQSLANYRKEQSNITTTTPFGVAGPTQFPNLQFTASQTSTAPPPPPQPILYHRPPQLIPSHQQHSTATRTATTTTSPPVTSYPTSQPISQPPNSYYPLASTNTPPRSPFYQPVKPQSILSTNPQIYPTAVPDSHFLPLREAVLYHDDTDVAPYSPFSQRTSSVFLEPASQFVSFRVPSEPSKRVPAISTVPAGSASNRANSPIAAGGSVVVRRVVIGEDGSRIHQTPLSPRINVINTSEVCPDTRTVVDNYEKLLKLEKDERRRVSRAKDQEIRNLKKMVQGLESVSRTGGDEGDIGSLIKTKEEEIRFMFENRDQQIKHLEKQLEIQKRLNADLKKVIKFSQGSETPEQLAKHKKSNYESKILELEGRLKKREKDVEEMLHELDEKNVLLKQLEHGQRHFDSTDQFEFESRQSSVSKEYSNARQQLREAHVEKRELQQLLTQKDKQIAAMGSIDPSMSESSAVQLGVQAISMVHSSLEYKEKIRALEAELSGMSEKYLESTETSDANYKKFCEKRKEAACLIETLASRDMRIAKLDTLLQHKDKEFKNFKEESRLQINTEREKNVKFCSELNIASGQNDKMRKELSSRDEKILLLQDDLVRYRTQILDLENRIATLQRELAESQSQIQKLVKQSIAKDKYLMQLEKRMKENDMKRQATYLQEIAHNRRLQLDMRLKEDDCRHALTDKEDVIRSLRGELNTSSSQIKAVKHLLVNSVSAVPASLHSEKRQRKGPRKKSHSYTHKPSTARQVYNPSEENVDDDLSFLTERSKRFVSQSRNKMPTSESLSHNKRQHSRAIHYSEKVHALMERSPKGLPSSFPNGYTSVDQLHTGDIDAAGILNALSCCYNPIKDDPLDLAVSDFLQMPENKHLASVVCRLTAGCYLLGDEKIILRLKDGEVHARQADGQSEDWSPFSKFLQNLKSDLYA